MRFGANYTHGVEQGDIALVVVSGVGVELNAIVLDGDFRERRSLGLAEHAGEEVEIVGHVVLSVYKVLIHTFAAVRIITLASAGSADKIERSIVGTVGTTFVTGAVLVVVHRHYLAIGDSAQNRFDTIGINRANHFVGMVMTL